MNDNENDDIQFDPLVGLAMVQLLEPVTPPAGLKQRLMERAAAAAPAPPGFSFRLAVEDDWLPHPVPGIRMKVLSMNRQKGIATLLLDVAPGAVFPPHHHGTDEECYVISGSLIACGRRIGPGDFHHADGGSDHGELRTEEGCQVLLVVAPEDYMPGFAG